MEAKLQAKIIKWLKEQGAYVIKTKPGMGTPVGCPDIVFFYDSTYGVIEVKADATSPYRPGQELTLKRFKKWNPYTYTAHPKNWEKIKAELLLTTFF